MRDRQEIEREMYEAREDLELNLVALESAVRAKIDVRARARVWLARARQVIAARPAVLTAVLAGTTLLGALAGWQRAQVTSRRW